MFAHRNSPILVNVAASTAIPKRLTYTRPRVAGFASKLAGNGAGAYVCFLEVGEGSPPQPERVPR